MSIKLKVNRDQWDDDEGRVGYILLRLGGKAAKQIYSRQEEDTYNPFVNVKDVFEELATVFEDSDRKRNYRRQFTALRIGSMKFAEFYSDFRRLSSFLKYNEELLIEELYNKVATRLQIPQNNQQFEFNTLDEAKRYIVKLDNSQRILRENREKTSSSRDDERLRNTKRVSFASIKSSLRRRSPPSNNVYDEDIKNDACYLCY